MPLPSFFASSDNPRPWSVSRAAAFGAVLGALAAIFKMLELVHHGDALAAKLIEIPAAALAFALLCALAAALRNVLVQRLS
jgi:uncharacterized membrane protein